MVWTRFASRRCATSTLLVVATCLAGAAGCADDGGSADAETSGTEGESGDTGLEPTLPPLDAPPPSTADRRFEPVTVMAEDPTDLDPRVPAERDMLLAMGYGDSQEVAGDTVVERTLDGSPAPTPGANRQRLTRFIHLADAQLADDESPARVVAVDSPGAISGAYRPQESYACHALASVVRTINAYDAEDPYDFVVLGGDNADNAQLNEHTWFRDILDGGVEVHCDSGDDDDPVAGPNNDPKDALVSEGLRPAWRWVTGNHDILVQGNFPVAPRQSEALGSEASSGTRDWSMPGGPMVTGTVVADEMRRLLTEPEVIDFVRATGDGHGLSQATSDYGKAEYVFDAGENVRVIVISTAAATGAATGVYRQAQVDDFLRNALDEAEADGMWVIIASHHGYNSIEDGSGLGGNTVADALTADQFASLLGEYANVLMHLAAHSHVHTATVIAPSSGNPYWELKTAAIADHPHQFRQLEVWDEDNGYVSVHGLALDYVRDDDPLAAEHYRQGVMDLSSGWNSDPGVGTAADRNVRLYVPKF